MRLRIAGTCRRSFLLARGGSFGIIIYIAVVFGINIDVGLLGVLFIVCRVRVG
jgi:hypothetical protein